MFLNNFRKQSECFFKFNTCKLRFLRAVQLKRYLNEDICTKTLTEIYRKCENGENVAQIKKGWCTYTRKKSHKIYVLKI